MSEIEKFIRREAAADEEWCGYRIRVRDDAEVFFRYVFFWATLPVWGPFLLVVQVCARLGRRLR